jgi:predicted nucleotidyltransferase
MNPEVQAIAQRIADSVHPERIILFGSQGTGQAGPDSDIDLLLIYKGPLSKRDVKLAVRRLFRRPEFSLDLFVLSPEEYERQRNVPSTLGHLVSREGVVCHG